MRYLNEINTAMIRCRQTMTAARCRMPAACARFTRADKRGFTTKTTTKT